MTSPNHTPRSNPQIDARDYQLLYEIERRMDERFDRARGQYKEDFTSALAPIIMRLEEGNRRFEDHSDRIALANKTPDIAKTEPAENALEKKSGVWVFKLGEKIVLPAIVAALSVVLSLWVMVQIKLVAFSDTTTNTPTVTQPKP